MNFRSVTLAILVCSIIAFAQSPSTADAPYQARYFANLNMGDSFINMINTGGGNPPYTDNKTQPICVNVFAINAASQQMLTCCSCYLDADVAKNFGVNRDILANLTAVPTSVVVKLAATLPMTTLNPLCGDPSAVSSQTLCRGLLAWGTTLHAGPSGVYAAESPFLPASLSPAELYKFGVQCSGVSKATRCICGQNGAI